MGPSASHGASNALATVAAPSDLAHLVGRARGYAAESKACGTVRAYAGDWKRFAGWCEARGVPPLPSTPPLVAVYLAALADSGRKVATVERALAAIAHANRAAGHEWAKGAAVVGDVLRGIRRKLGSAPAKKAPLLAADLRAVVATLGVDLAGLRDRALLTLGWFGAFRRSELVALDVRDVAFVRDGLIVRLRRSKTDQEARGIERGIPYAGDPALCPVRSLRAWLDAAHLTEGAAFRAVKGASVGASGLSGRTVARIVKGAAERAGLDPRTLAGHSLRAGFATSAAASGKSLDAIMRQTGHKSERVARGYIRHATLFTDNAATGLV